MRVKEFNEGFEITFEFDKRLTWAIKKLMEICPGSEKDKRRKSYIFPKCYAPQVIMFGQKYVSLSLENTRNEITSYPRCQN